MTEEAGYIYSFILLSVLVLTLIPLFIISFNLQTPVNALTGFGAFVVDAYSAVFDGIANLIKFLFDIVQLVITAAAYIADGLTLNFVSSISDFIDALPQFFISIDTIIDTYNTMIHNAMGSLIGAYASLPAAVVLILVAPFIGVIIYAGIKLIPMVGS